GFGGSAILVNYGNSSYFQSLFGYLTPVLTSFESSYWIRCWHGASDGWDVTTTFHVQCKMKKPTVVLLRVGSYVFGGFSDQYWTASEDTLTYAASSKAFLFSLYNKNGYQPFKVTVKNPPNAKALCGYAKFGPTFGSSSGYDLYISNDASTKLSYSRILNYHIPPGCSFNVFCTTYADTTHFYLSDIEVFYGTF
ncbi:hypothetical protein QZH41_012907, partial [Actinostola sp. cb2023]